VVSTLSLSAPRIDAPDDAPRLDLFGDGEA